jgi:hypothetical protein
MADAERKAAGGKLNRTETVTIRLDPKMRYLAELASRVQRRSLSSYIEWAIDRSFDHVPFPGRENATLADMASQLWDVDEPDRFVTLAIEFPDLLNHEEQKRWKLIRENGALWAGAYAPKHGKKQWTWNPKNQANLLIERLREHWDVFVMVARDEATAKSLPTWNRYESDGAPVRTSASTAKAPTVGDDFSDFPAAIEDDDDLPF